MKLLIFIAYLGIFFLLASCGGSSDENNSEETGNQEAIYTPKTKEAGPEEIDPMQDKGIGPIKSITLGDLDQALADKGAEEFKSKCSACHKADKKYIGPSPQGVLDRRTPEWVMNMILNPEEMVEKNAQAKKLLMEFNGTPMANQSLTEDEARAILEYFRTLK